MRLRVILSLFVICSVGIAPSIAQSKLVEVASNNIRAKIFNTGVLFNDVASGQPAFEVPIGSNTHAFFSAALTMGGLDHNSSLRMASGYAANSDYSVGPLTIGTATNSDSVRMYYNRIWEVNKNQINLHRANYSDPTYTIPVDILEWPAHDTVWAGYDFDLAPFVDVDQNGLYEPQKGDYPEIQGDFAFYFINNDATQHILTNTLAIGAEVHCMVYGFANNTTLNETLFADYRVINRSNIDYTNFYVGLYADTDLGNHMDDYLEADVDRGMIFAKNGDAFDDPVLGYSGYGDHPGAAGILVLRGP